MKKIISKLIICALIINISANGGFCAPKNNIIGSSDGPTAITVKSKAKEAKANEQKDYVVQKLPSGQTVIVMPVNSNPIVTIDTWIKTGSINENDKNSGVAHFLEHLFFKGTEKTPPGEFDRILESKGGVTNAATR